MFGYISFNTFLGKTIDEVLINSTKSTMRWNVDGVWFNVEAIGDCCSYSWFEHCDNADVFSGAKLIEFESFDGDSYQEEDGYHYVQVNMLKFKTDKGHCTIEFRNSSNGYYSGWTEIRKVEGQPNNSDFKKMVDF